MIKTQNCLLESLNWTINELDALQKLHKNGRGSVGGGASGNSGSSLPSGGSKRDGSAPCDSVASSANTNHDGEIEITFTDQSTTRGPPKLWKSVSFMVD